MNQLGRDALRAAALRGVRQIVGLLVEDDGRCALGVLAYEGRQKVLNMQILKQQYDLDHPVMACPLCEISYPPQGVSPTEEGLILHLNDDHHLDFLGIAEKMPVSEEPTDGV